MTMSGENEVLGGGPSMNRCKNTIFPSLPYVLVRAVDENPYSLTSAAYTLWSMLAQISPAADIRKRVSLIYKISKKFRTVHIQCNDIKSAVLERVDCAESREYLVNTQKHEPLEFKDFAHEFTEYGCWRRPFGLSLTHRPTVKSDTLADVCSVHLQRHDRLGELLKDEINRKLILLGHSIRPAFSQTPGFYTHKANRSSASSHSLSDTMRQLMNQNWVVKRPVSVWLNGGLRVSAQQSQALEYINITVILSQRYTLHCPLWPLRNSSERFQEGLKEFDALGWSKEPCTVHHFIIVDWYQDRITALATCSEVVILEVEGLLREPIAVGDVMNNVCCVECIGTRRIGILPILGAPFDVVEIFELMSSFDALHRCLVPSINERDDIVSAGTPDRYNLDAVNQEQTTIRTMYLWTQLVRYRAIREERRHCLQGWRWKFRMAPLQCFVFQ